MSNDEVVSQLAQRIPSEVVYAISDTQKKPARNIIVTIAMRPLK